MVRTTDHDVTRTVESASEFRDAVDAADTLGIELAAVEFAGEMTANDDRASFNLRHGGVEVRREGRGGSSVCDFDTFDAGYKWFTVRVDGDVTKIRPIDDDVLDNDGRVRLFFDGT